MLYLDYSANTPVDEEVLQCFCEAERRYPGNANAHHQAGTTAKAAINEATGSIARCLGAPPAGIIYTSGAMQKYVDARGDFVNNKGVMSATTEAGTNSNPLFGGQDQFQILFNSADKIDMSIASEYDAKINTDLQNAVQDYCKGVTSSEDDCLNAFLDAVAADVTDITVE